MLSVLIAFLVMLNPFALFLYLMPVMRKVSRRDYFVLLFEASIISFLIYTLFLFLGQYIFSTVFRISFESFRIFGGIVIFSYAYTYIVRGEKALIHMKGTLDDIASEVALPFMVGAGTISLTILLSQKAHPLVGVLAILGVLAVNFGLIALLGLIRDSLRLKKFRIAFDKNMEILLRLTGFLIGAVGVDLFLTGVRNVFFSSP